MLTNTKIIVISSSLFVFFSLVLSIVISDVEWFQASGAVMTIAGVILAARKIIRLGFEEFMRNEQTIDCGHIVPTPEEIESQNQFERDIHAYRVSIILLVFGTFIWAYGGIILKLCGIQA